MTRKMMMGRAAAATALALLLQGPAAAADLGRGGSAPPESYGGQIYNWNGGHPNGKTELPPVE